MSQLPAEPIKILFIAAEADPFVKIGGLGDYAGSLPLAIRNIHPELIQNYKIDIRLVIPFHGKISVKKWGIKFLTKFAITENNKSVIVRTYITQIEGLPVYLISRNRQENYSAPVYPHKSFQNSRKYAFFSVACLELMKHLNWKADVIHANDWHTSFSILKLKELKRETAFYSKIKTLLTIHNLAYMGAGSEIALKYFRLDPVKEHSLPSWAQTQPLPMGLALADKIIAVSPSYSKEITTPKFGYGLEKLFLKRRKSLSGILNGIDYQKWDPLHDKCIENTFSTQNISYRLHNKQSLQRQFELSCQDKNIPLITIISRLDSQKGIDLLIDGFMLLVDIPLQLIILGSGNKGLEKDCENLENKYPERVRTVIRYDEMTARRLYSGADIILIPSRFEPCGTTQMIAMRYGCIPVARATGGLKDSIEDGKNGFLFIDSTPSALVKTIRKAIRIYRNKPSQWKLMQIQAMKSDFSWNNSALLYAKNYLNLLTA